MNCALGKRYYLNISQNKLLTIKPIFTVQITEMDAVHGIQPIVEITNVTEAQLENIRHALGDI